VAAINTITTPTELANYIHLEAAVGAFFVTQAALSHRSP